MHAETQPAAHAAAAPSAAGTSLPQRLLSLLDALLETWREMAAVRVGLLAHDLRGAGLAIAAMIGMAVAAACLAASTWLVLLGIGLHLAVKTGLSWEAAGLLLLLVNGSLFAMLIAAVRRTGGGLLARTLATIRATSREDRHEPVQQ